jgi:hypothetical protein
MKKILSILISFAVIAAIFVAISKDISKEEPLTQNYIINEPYTIIKGGNATFVFWQDSTMHRWKWSIDSYKSHVYLGNFVRENSPEVIAKTIEFIQNPEVKEFLSKFTSEKYLLLKTPEGESFRVMNFAPFVSPEFFMHVISPQPAEREVIIKKFQNITAQLSSYSPEIEETPKLPGETLLEGGGDCEDLTILLASMLKAAGLKVSLIYFNAQTPNIFAKPNHVAVLVEDGKEMLVEPTGKKYSQKVKGWSFPV